MAATARATAVRNMSSMSRCWSIPTPNITAHTPTHTRDSTLDTSPIFCCKGVSPWSWFSSSPAMRPISEAIPVAVITTRPRPPVMTVPPMTMFRRSAKGVSGARAPPACLWTGRDSPVMADSSACSSAAHSTRPSAGTKSPASKSTTSPGTSWALSKRSSCPPRTTRVLGAESCCRASRAFRALSSWETEITVLKATINRMMAASNQSSPPPAK